MRVGVLGNPRYRELPALLARLAAHAPRHQISLATERALVDLWPDAVPVLDAAPERLDLVMTFGGDGTLLRGARFAAPRQVPVLGVNLGRVGYLTAATSETLEAALTAVGRGDYHLERRQMLEARAVAADGAVRFRELALNDAVVHKAGVARVIRVEAFVNGEAVAQYAADGIIVATPTGSTAYSLSAGGPVVVPEVDALVITAICPHTLAVRPIVVPGDAEIMLHPIPPWADELLVSCDGQVGCVLQPHDRVVVHRSPNAVSLIRLGKEGFFAGMRRKLHWGDPSERDEAGRAG